MRILHIIPNLSGGGAERFVVDLVNEMSLTNEVYLCTLYELVPGKNDFFAAELSKSVKLISLNKKLGLDLKIFNRINELISDIKPDVVNTHLAAINYVLPSIVFKKLVFKKCQFFHTIHSDAKIEVKHWLEFLSRKILYKLKWLAPITISEESQQSFRNYYNVVNDNLVYNGRKFESTTPALEIVRDEFKSYRKHSDTKVLVNIGRFVPLKNQYFLAKIVEDLNKEGFNICLLIIGDYSSVLSDSIKQQILSLGSTNVHLLGVKRNIVDYLSLSDAFCLSSTYEGMPISLIEAMSVGCIPICTPVGGLKNIIFSTTLGYLSEEVSEESFKNAIKKYYYSTENDAIRTGIIKRYHEVFNIESTSKNYLKIYCK